MKQFKRWHYLTLGAFVVLVRFVGFLLLKGNNVNREVIPLKANAVKASYDVVVVGGDPEGVAAAVAAARSGRQTLLVDTRLELGGLMTRGWPNSLDTNYGPGKEIPR